MITPHLWFDKEAKEAAKFYASAFPKAKVTSVSRIYDTPSGDCDIVGFEIYGQPFMAISAGPMFKVNPSISFIVNVDPLLVKDARKQLDKLWAKLSQGGQALMPLDKYPFSERYGWIQDRFSVSWQLMLTDPKGDRRPFIVPSLLFVGPNVGRAEEAATFYRSVFKKSKKGFIARYPKGQGPDKEGTVMFMDFQLDGTWFGAMDSAHDHKFNFNEAVSLMIPCKTQKEIDYYWEKLSAVPEAEQCGWLKDKCGISWQVTPADMGKMLKGSKAQVKRVTEAFLAMKKFDLKRLKAAYLGK
jgi:predicted 3-demethylubiquinone-9 3-methyltransferase (glyoxalase superfamily)